MFFDPLYLLVMVPGMLLSLWASMRVKSTFNRYSQVGSRSGLTGADAARELLRRQNINGVTVEPVEGFLSDHYDPSSRTLRLSPDVYHGRSLSALGVAAHEAGHAIQHAHGYGPLAFRSMVVRPAMIGSNLGMIVMGLGLATHVSGMVWLGVLLFSAFVVFTLITLPVEFNASSRAVAALVDTGIITPSESLDTKKVLDAAALTYVAAAISAVMQLLYFLWRAGLLGGSRQEE
ncbi:MAG TPA: zinc metallopeptidase [Polyangiales bacterium]|nr:zinc metallopeptidase [Polyangiales bacterium]